MQRQKPIIDVGRRVAPLLFMGSFAPVECEGPEKGLTPKTRLVVFETVNCCHLPHRTHQ
jgi:hypothetical protein